MDSRARLLIEQGDRLFTQRMPMMTLWQEVADNFYVERADFTVQRSMGQDFANHLTTSYPLLVRRDLGNSISAILRPTGKEWFEMRASRPDREDLEARRYLEWATGVQRRAMYDRNTLFTRATKEGDHDFTTFGQAVLSVELNRDTNTLLYRCWHLRDVAWCESFTGKIDTVHRKWKPTAQQLVEQFKDKVHPNVRDALSKDRYREISCRHVVVPASQYEGGKQWRTPLVSVYIDVDNQHVMQEEGVRINPYVIPRWQTVSGHQYAYSPAVVCALPDARLLQAMTLSILEAGEKAANPPLVAVQEAVRSDLAVYAGGVTWVDATFDGKLQDVLRPISQDKSGLPLGIEMQSGIHELLSQAFYLNKLTLPMMAGDMTATEVSQRVQEYIRQATPLFEPMEAEYNAALCERTFDVLMDAGAFGPAYLIPHSLRGQDITFRFESPLQQAAERQLGQTLLEAKQAMAALADLDPTVIATVDAVTAIRETLQAIGVPASWMRSPQAVAAMVAQQQREQGAQQLLASMGQGAQIVETLGKAGAAAAEVAP